MTITFLTILTGLLRASLSSDLICPRNCTCAHMHGRFTTDCSYRGLTEIPDKISDKTMVLLLDGNDFSRMRPKDFYFKHNLQHLTQLSMSHCGLTDMRRNTFSALKNLRRLTLSHNNFTRLTFDFDTKPVSQRSIFEHIFLPNLLKLDFAYNRIRELPADAFIGATNLEEIDFGHNRLHFVDETSFKNLLQLKVIHLNDNQLAGLRPTIFDQLSSLHLLNLINNPWHCECHLRLMVKWERPRYLSSPPTCENPPQHRGKRWDQLRLDEFACSPILKKEHGPGFKDVPISAEFGDTVKMTCSVDKNSQASMSWLFKQNVSSDFLDGQLFGTFRDPKLEKSHKLVQNSLRVSISNTFDMTKSNSRLTTLTILRAQIEDTGEYICRAENAIDVAEDKFSLQVLPPRNDTGSGLQQERAQLNSTYVIILVASVVGLSLLLTIGTVIYCHTVRRKLKQIELQNAGFKPQAKIVKNGVKHFEINADFYHPVNGSCKALENKSGYQNGGNHIKSNGSLHTKALLVQNSLADNCNCHYAHTGNGVYFQKPQPNDIAYSSLAMIDRQIYDNQRSKNVAETIRFAQTLPASPKKFHHGSSNYYHVPTSQTGVTTPAGYINPLQPNGTPATFANPAASLSRDLEDFSQDPRDDPNEFSQMLPLEQETHDSLEDERHGNTAKQLSSPKETIL